MARLTWIIKYGDLVYSVEDTWTLFHDKYRYFDTHKEAVQVLRSMNFNIFKPIIVRYDK